MTSGAPYSISGERLGSLEKLKEEFGGDLDDKMIGHRAMEHQTQRAAREDPPKHLCASR
jgi:hypothetical protein